MPYHVRYVPVTTKITPDARCTYGRLRRSPRKSDWRASAKVRVSVMSSTAIPRAYAPNTAMPDTTLLRRNVPATAVMNGPIVHDSEAMA